MNTEQPQESFGSGASEAPAARSAEVALSACDGIKRLANDALRYQANAVLWAHSPGSSAEFDARRERARSELASAADALQSQRDSLLDALLEALEFIEDCADVSDGPDGSPRPNRAMQLCEPIRAALAKAGVKP
jgi:hypothetical protein